MKKNIKIFILLFCLVFSFPVMAQGTFLQKTAFYTPDDSAVTLKKFEGKAVVVFLWSENCPICLLALQNLDKIYKKIMQNAVIIPLMTKEANLTKARKIYTAHNIRYLPIYIDKKDVFALTAGMTAMPLVLMFDETGSEIFRKSGKIDWLLTKLLEKAKPETRFSIGK